MSRAPTFSLLVLLVAGGLLFLTLFRLSHLDRAERNLDVILACSLVLITVVLLLVGHPKALWFYASLWLTSSITIACGWHSYREPLSSVVLFLVLYTAVWGAVGVCLWLALARDRPNTPLQQPSGAPPPSGE